MPRVVPSQIVFAIDGLFGVPRNELEMGVIRFPHRDNVRVLLALLDQVPGDLLTVPAADHIEYLQCRSSLTSAMSAWDALHPEIIASNIGGRDPIERIRRIMATCPDENSPPVPDLAFIPDDAARASVQQDVRAAWIDFRAGEWKGATVFPASAVEALLFWALKGRADLQDPERLDKRHLRQYIDEAERLAVITNATAQQARLATDARDLIHAGKMARTGLACTQATALRSLAALAAVLEDLPNSS